MRLIDADNVKIPKDAPYKASVKRVVAMQPTVEAREVVHGEWMYDENANDWGIGGWRCSECGCKNNNLGCDPKIPVYWFAGSKFCPQCGADMRKKV